MTKRINWKLRRLGYHCRCDACKGKFWQARYGESSTQFRLRFLNTHRGKPT
jgi:hypothetical protein